MRKSIKYICLLTITVFVIWSCVPNPGDTNTDTMQDPCMAEARIKPKDTIPGSDKKQPELYGNKGLKWKGVNTLYVYFFDGNDTVRNKVLEIANEWYKHTSIRFMEVGNKPNSQIRVAFDRGGGYASLIGTQALLLDYDDQPTMYLSRIGDFLHTDPVKFRRIVLHEFGHVMALEHEIKNPEVSIPWDTSAVIKYFHDHFGWDKTKVNKNIFEKATDGYASDYDPNSIMIYAIPDTLLKDKSFKTGWTNELSEKDKIYISKWYKN